MEQIDELRRPEAHTRLMYQIVFSASATTIGLTVGYGVLSAILSGQAGAVGFGPSLVNTSFPSSYFAEPATYLSVACVTFFYTALRLWQNKVAQWSHLKLATLQLFALVIAFVAAYEVMFNFMAWGSYLSLQLVHNSVGNVLAAPISTPWNLVLATKMFAALFIISGYAAYFLRRVHEVRGLVDAF
jgi:hypothetical protein